MKPLTNNQIDILRELRGKSGSVDIATSQYAMNTWKEGSYPDAWGSSAAVRGLESRGYLADARNGWRYYSATMTDKLTSLTDEEFDRLTNAQ